MFGQFTDSIPSKTDHLHKSDLYPRIESLALTMQLKLDMYMGS